ncbi:hypothetical protein FQZ97_721620 [compost metagenome]
MHHVESGIRAADLDIHASEGTQLGQRTGDGVTPTDAGAGGYGVLVLHLNADDHAGGPAGRELSRTGWHADQVIIELVRLSAGGLGGSRRGAQVDTSSTSGGCANLIHGVPPDRRDIACHALPRAIDGVARIAAQRNDGGVPDLDVAGVDLELTLADAEQRLHPDRTLVLEPGARRHNVVGEDLVLAGHLTNHVAEFDLVGLDGAGRDRRATLGPTTLRQADARHEELHHRLQTGNGRDGDGEGVGTLRLDPDGHVIVRLDLVLRPARPLHEQAIDLHADGRHLPPLIALGVVHQPALDGDRRGDAVLAPELGLQLVPIECDHGRKPPGRSVR